MFKPLKVFIVLLLIGRTAIAEQEGFSLPGPENFTHTATISLLNEKAVIARAGLPQWVYAASLHDLADVRVFNAEGLEVGFRLLPLLNQGKSQEFAVNALPLPPDANAESLNRAANVKVDISGKVDIHLDESPIQDSSTSSKITQ